MKAVALGRREPLADELRRLAGLARRVEREGVRA